MVDSATKVSASSQIYRSTEIRPKILMRADSVPATYFPTNTMPPGGELTFRVSDQQHIRWSVTAIFLILTAGHEGRMQVSPVHFPNEKFNNMRWILPQRDGNGFNEFHR